MDLGIAEADWQFRTSFSVSAQQLSEPEVDLVFEGLDTYCDILLVCSLPPVRVKLTKV